MKLSLKDIKDRTGKDVKNAALVTCFGLVFDNYKLDQLPKLWCEAEKIAVKKMPTLDTSTLFFQEDMIKEGEKTWYSFRFYTPADNLIS